MADDFIQQIARLLGQSPDDTRRTLTALADTIRQDVENAGEAQIEGLGVFRQDGEGLAFEPAPALARAVNHRYAGLKALESGADTAQADEADEPESLEGSTLTTSVPDDAASLDTPEAAPDEAEESDETPEEEVLDAFAEEEPVGLDLPTAPPPEPVRDLASPPSSGDTAEPVALTGQDEMEQTAEPESPTEADVQDATPEAEGDMASEEPAGDLDVVLEGNTLDEDALVEDHLEVAPESDDADTSDDEIDALLEGVWTSTPDRSDTHPLGTAPSDDVEDIDYALVDEDASDEVPEPTDVLEPVRPTEPAEEITDAPEPVDAELDDSVSDLEEEALEEEERPPLDVLVGAGAAASAPTPESHDAPGFAATAAPTERETRAPRERPSRAPVFLGLAAVVLIALGVFWFMNREPTAPAIVEGPAPADTVATAPVVVPADSTSPSASDTPEDPTDPTPTDPAPTAEPAAPPATASADPLRSSEGIDRAAGGFSWVIGSELSREPAERRVASFRDQGFRADVIAEEAAGRTRYRVALGQFDSIEEAERRRADLPAGVPTDTWLLRL